MNLRNPRNFVLLFIMILFNINDSFAQCPTKITTQPDDSTICSGNNVSFEIAASSADTYQWQESTNGGSNWSDISNGGVYGGATTTTLLITGAPNSMSSYEYRCKATNTANKCTVNSSAAELKVNPTPTITNTTPGYVCSGNSGQVGATTITGYKINWYAAATGGVPLGTGNTYNSGSLTSTTTYYAQPVPATLDDSLSSGLFATNNNTGAFFDIKVKNNITLTDVSWRAASSSTYDVDVYMRTGTASGNESSSSGWNKVGSVTGQSTSSGDIYKITLNTPQNLTAGQTYGFFVVRDGSGSSIHYHTANTPGAGKVWSENDDLQMITGNGASSVFGGISNNNRMFDGIMWYEKTPPCSTSNRTAVNINVDAPPAISAQPKNTTVCNIEDAKFSTTAVNDDTYQWQLSTNNGSTWSNIANGGVYSNATTSTLDITAAPYSMNGYQYRCEITSPCSVSTTTNTATLTVDPPPAITTQPNNKTICETTGTTFTVSTANSDKYQWQVSTNGGSTWSDISNGGIYADATTKNLKLSNVPASANSNQYRCIVNGPCKPSVTSNAVTLTVETAPDITTDPDDVISCVGSNTSFSCAATGAVLTYQWQVNTGSSWSNVSNNANYSGATTNTLSVTNITAGMDNNQYRCEVSGKCSPSDFTDAATLDIGAAPMVTTQPTDRQACTGITSSISLDATGYNISYQWQESINNGITWTNVTNGAVYSGANTDMLVFQNPVILMNGNQYRCVVTNGCAINTTSNEVVLTVTASPVVTQEPVNTTICEGDNGALSVTATSTGTINYQWQKKYGANTWYDLVNDGTVSGVKTNTLSINNSTTYNNGEYRCVLNTGCTPAATSATATIEVKTRPEITLGPTDVTLCEGLNANFSVGAKGTNISYQWEISTNGGTSWSNVTNGGIYTGATTKNLKLNTVTASNDGNLYRCVVSGDCPTAKTSAPAKLTVNVAVTITSQSTADINICEGGNGSFFVNATGSGLTYQWKRYDGSVFQPISNGGIYSGAQSPTLNITNAPPGYYLFFCTVQGICDADKTNNRGLAVDAEPRITQDPTNDIVCHNTKSLFGIKATGTNITYQWQVNMSGSWSNLSNNTTYSGVNSDLLTISTATNSMNGYRYRCVVSGKCAPDATSAQATLTVNPLQTPSLTISADKNDICDGEKVTFTPKPTNGGSSPQYKWKKNGNIVASGATYSSTTLANADIISVEMASSINCPSPRLVNSSNVIQMKVTQNVTPTITITSDNGTDWCTGKENVFRSSITNGGSSPDYEWSLNGTPWGFNADTLYMPVLNDGDEIVCKLTSDHKCPSPEEVNSNKLTMTIRQTTFASIVISANPDSTICEQTKVTMYSAFTNGGSTPDFQWRINGQNVPGATQPTFSTTNLQDADEITCRFNSSNTCVFPEISNNISFDVIQNIEPEVSVEVSYNGANSYTFTAIPVNEGAAPKYQWYRNFNPIFGETGSTYTADDLVPSDRIYVEMASSFECVAPSYELVQSGIKTTSVGGIDGTVNELNLHPNPNTGKFIITGTLNKATNDDVVIRISNAVGQEVYRNVYSASGNKLNIPVELGTEMANGVYTVHLVIDGVVNNIRFVVNR